MSEVNLFFQTCAWAPYIYIYFLFFMDGESGPDVHSDEVESAGGAWKCRLLFELIFIFLIY